MCEPGAKHSILRSCVFCAVKGKPAVLLLCKPEGKAGEVS